MAVDLELLWRALCLKAGPNHAWVALALSLLGAAAGHVGSFALLRRRALLVDVLGHATLPGVCLAFLVAAALGAEPRSLAWLWPGGALSALLAAACLEALLRHTRLQSDAVLGVVLASFFGFGLLLLSHIQTRPGAASAGLDRLLFGQAAALSFGDAAAMLALAALVETALLIFGRRLRVLAFDPGFARLAGFDPPRLDRLLHCLLGAIALAALPAVGAVLLVALVVLPAATARLWSDSAQRIEAVAALLGALAGFLGAALSRSAPDLSTGPLVVCLLGVAFAVGLLVAPRHGLLWGHARRRRALEQWRRRSLREAPGLLPDRSR
jgi:manganese/zinc/iron transport system permease protein